MMIERVLYLLMKINGNIRNIVGNETEQKIAKLFRERHYYVYITPHKANGQPVDIICISKHKSFLLDAKHVESGKISFPFSRIEPNQRTTMMYAKDWAGLENLGFGLYFEDTKILYWLPYDKVLEYEKDGFKSIKYEELDRLENFV